MKKLLLILLLINTIFADDLSTEKKIYESFFSALSPKEKPLIYTDKSIPSLQLVSEKFSLISDCTQADIIVMAQRPLDERCQDKIVFGTRYRHLREPYVVGAFFWQKGRPNIVFLEEALKKHKITLPPELEDYLE